MTNVATVPVALALFLGLAASGPPDSWLPFAKRRVVSPGGSVYAVLQSEDGYQKGTFELARRRDGAEPLPELPGGQRGVNDEDIVRDARDALIGKGALPQLPLEIAILEDSPGLLLFECYARVGYGKSLIRMAADGTVVWSKTLKELFGRYPRATTFTASSAWWYTGWGVDEGLGFVWLLTRGGELRVVELEDGTVRQPDQDQIVRLFTIVPEEDRATFLDALVQNQELDLTMLLPLLDDFASDGDAPLKQRIAAAVLCRRAGALSDFGELLERGLRDDEMDTAVYAGMHGAVLAPDTADRVAPLAGVMKRFLDRSGNRNRNADGLPRGLVECFDQHGAPARAALDALLAAEGVDGEVRAAATTVKEWLEEAEGESQKRK